MCLSSAVFHLALSSPLEREATQGCEQQARPVASSGTLAGKRQGTANLLQVDGEAWWHKGQIECL